MARARRRLEQSGVHPREVLDLEDFGGRVGAVLGKAAVHGDAVGVEVLAEEGLAAAAVEALVAELAVVGRHAIANGEALDVLDEESVHVRTNTVQ